MVKELTLILLRYVKYKIKLARGIERVNVYKSKSQVVLCTDNNQKCVQKVFWQG